MVPDPDDRSGPPRNPIEELGVRRAQRARKAVKWGPAYQGATEATLAVAICVGIGIWIDSKLDSSPAGMLIGLGIGFGSFVLRLWRLLQETTPSNGETSGPTDGRTDAPEGEGDDRDRDG
jgi:F0F1-type ATP synthase assembly protein I